MEQAKWYCLEFKHSFHHHDLKERFYCKVLIYLLKDNGIKRIGKLSHCKSLYYYKPRKTIWHCWYEVPVFCGKKKLNMLLREAHLLGLEDELLIFERKGEK